MFPIRKSGRVFAIMAFIIICTLIAIFHMSITYHMPLHLSFRLNPRSDTGESYIKPGISHTYITNTKHINSNYKDHEDLQSIFSHADNVTAMGHVILITMLNQAFLPFAFSWLCNTKYMDIHEQVLMVTTDNESYQQLQSMWPKVHTVFWQIDDSLREDLNYSHAGYLRYMMLRSGMLKELIIRNHDILLF